MPVYDYKCKNHGLFHELATLEDSAKPAKCPKCNNLSGRIIMFPSGVLTMESHKRHAAKTNEKARFEPEFSTTNRRTDDEQHAKGCGCSKSKVGGSKMLLTANGEKIFPSMRPWMIHH